jgi:hypothetical protein
MPHITKRTLGPLLFAVESTPFSGSYPVQVGIVFKHAVF